MIFLKSKFLGILSVNKRTSLAIQQIIYSFGTRSVSIFISFLYVPLLLDVLDKERYGLWLLLVSILDWFKIFNLGLGKGLKNRLTESIAVCNQRLSKEYISTTYALLIFIFTIVSIVFIIVNIFIDWQHILNTSSVPIEELKLLAFVVFIFLVARFISSLIGVIYEALQKPSVDNTLSTISSILSLVSIYSMQLAFNRVTLIQLALVLCSVPVFVYILFSIYVFNSKLIHLRPSIKNVNFECIGPLMILGKRFFFIQISSIVVFSSGNIIIAQFLNLQEVVTYNIVSKLFGVPLMLYSIFMSPIWASVTNAYIKKDFQWLKNTLRQLNLLSVFFSLGIAIMILFSDKVYAIWVGESVHVPFIMTLLFGFYTILKIFLSPYSNYINGFGKVKITSDLSFLWVILSSLISILLIIKLKNTVAIIISLIITLFLSAIAQVLQTYKIIEEKDKGVWSK